MIPDELIDRKKKGFGIPLVGWINSGAIKPPAEGTFLRELDSRLVTRKWNDQREGRRDWRLFLWSWLSAEYSAAVRLSIG